MSVFDRPQLLDLIEIAARKHEARMARIERLLTMAVYAGLTIGTAVGLSIVLLLLGINSRIWVVAALHLGQIIR
jgi:hypothetical protein